MKLPATEIEKYIPEQTIEEQLKHNKALLGGSIIRKEPIITYRGEPLFFQRTINMIQGSFGSHKSRLAGHIASVLIGDNEIIGMSANKQYRVLYCDTERDIEDELPIDMKNIIKLSGMPVSENKFNYYSFYDIERSERADKLKEIVETVRDEHLIVFLDVATDFVLDFNSLKYTNEFIDFSSRLIKNLNCTLFLVIHENPGKENKKARGHIGTELGNKSNTILSIAQEPGDNELYKIKMLKQRRAKRINNIYVRYSDNFEGLVLADRQDIVTDGYKITSEDFANFIINLLKDGEAMWQQEIIQKSKEEFSVSERTVRNKFQELKEKPELLLGYKLDLTKGNKNRNYFRLIRNENLLF